MRRTTIASQVPPGGRAVLPVSLSSSPLPILSSFRLLMPRNVVLNDTLEASTSKGEASCACITLMRQKRKKVCVCVCVCEREREKERSIRFFDSNTNYRLPNRPLTRRLVDSPFAISATQNIWAYGYVLVLVVREHGNGIHGHARLSNLDPSQRIARLARPRLSFYSLDVFVGRRVTRFGIYQGVDHVNLQEATRARDNCLVASRIDFFLSFCFCNELSFFSSFFVSINQLHLRATVNGRLSLVVKQSALYLDRFPIELWSA